MGERVKYRCRDCGEEWIMNIGSGMLHGSAEVIKKEFPEDMWDEVDRLYSSGNGRPVLENLSFSFTPAVCKKCRCISAVPVLKSEISEKMLIGPCQECGKKTVELIRSISKTACPSCRKTSLEIISVGLWD